MPSVMIDSDDLPPFASAKKGLTLACGYGDMKRMTAEVAYLRASWVWNWTADTPRFPNVESVPCIVRTTKILPNLDNSNSNWVLGFNEPDINNENGMPDDVAQAWAAIEAAYPTRRLASPQPSHRHPEWLGQFRDAYIQRYGHAPRLDALAGHCYLTVDECKALVESYIKLAAEWGVPEVWLTEFAVSPSTTSDTVPKSASELGEFVNWLEANVSRYAIWTNRLECCAGAIACQYDPMMDAPMFYWWGEPSSFGRLYRRLPEN